MKAGPVRPAINDVLIIIRGYFEGGGGLVWFGVLFGGDGAFGFVVFGLVVFGLVPFRFVPFGAVLLGVVLFGFVLLGGVVPGWV